MDHPREGRAERKFEGSVPPSAVVPPFPGGATRFPRPEHLYKTVALAFLAAIVYRFFDEISRVFLTMYAAAILGVAFNILVGLFPRQRKWVTGAIGVSVVALLGFAVWAGLPALARQFRAIARRAPQFDELLRGWGEWLSEVTGLNIPLVGAGTSDLLEDLFAGIDGTEVLGRATGLIDLVLIPLLILIGGLYAVGKPNDRLLTPFMRAVPRDRRLAFRRLLELLGIRLRGWITGTAIAMLAVGVLTTAALSLVGARYALLLGTVNGILEFVPIIGPWVGGTIAVIVTFLDSPGLAFWVLIIVVAIQQIESNLITPIVMSKTAEVHPFVTIFAIVLFGSIFGFLGIFLALPIVILLWTAIEVLWVERAIDTDEDRIAPIVEE